MKVLFMPAKSNYNIKEVLKKVNIKGNIGLVASAQYIHKLKEVQELLPNSKIAGQVLGCNALAATKIANEIDAFLFIGSGPFHPFELAIKTKKPIYVANPKTNEVSQIKQEDIEAYKNRTKAKLIKFYAADKLGILVSKKPGQNNIRSALRLKEKLDKECYIFAFDTLKVEEFENFPDIDLWINTACPRIENKKIINMRDLPKI